MARIVRVEAPEFPHHITRRGDRRQKIFFKDEDFQTDIDELFEWCPWIMKGGLEK